jgi:hypothetical protein
LEDSKHHRLVLANKLSKRHRENKTTITVSNSLQIKILSPRPTENVQHLFGLITQGAWNVGFAKGSERAEHRRKEKMTPPETIATVAAVLFRSESFSAPFSVSIDLELLMAN